MQWWVGFTSYAVQLGPHALTETRHVDSLWKLIQEKAQLVLQEPGLALEED